MSTLQPQPPRRHHQHQRPSLYNSAIQQVLVLQEENTPPSATDPPAADSHPADSASPHLPSDPNAPQRPWHTGLHSLNPNPTRSPPPPARGNSQPHHNDRRRTLWRVMDRSRTRHGILVLCLHIGVDPPDIVKPNPCARLQCWHHPQPEQSGASLKTITSSLKAQYERWADRDSKFKACPDPTDHDLKRACTSLRRAAHEHRILFHYNGHGVPRPTANGEIWVFNSDFSQYIPMNIFDLHEVLGSPALYIFDCHSAGTVLNHFHKLHQHLDREWHTELRRANSAGRSYSGQTHPHLAPHSPPHHQSVFLAACADGQLLPLAPHVPADLFTSCLTTPIKTALRWFARRSLVPHITPAMLDRIPGKYNLRSSPLGDLEYVFTAVSDAIAWNVLPRDLFKRLYRQDVLLASLMRNFLLAQRILRSFGCDPVSYPEIPATHNHPLWQSFDLAMENLLSQLPIMLAKEDMQRRIAAREVAEREAAAAAASAGATSSKESQNQFEMQHNSLSTLHHRREDPVLPGIDPDTLSTFVYRPSSFFDDQMKAFDIWLDMGPDFRDPPEQLPVMLQVLLSPAWGVKALQLISRYMQTGPMAVDESLSVGVFPYMSQLLKNHQIREIRNDLVFIWSKILALDDSCRVEIVKSEVDEYFVRFLASSDKPKPVYLACALFVLSVVARDHADRCQKIGAVDACVHYLAHSNSFVRRWACLCLSEILRRAVHRTQLSALANEQLIHLLRRCAVDDLAPDVRAAAVSTLNAIMAGVLRHVSKEIKNEASTRPSPPHLDANGSGPIVVDSTAGGTDGSASTTPSVPSSSPPPYPPVSTPTVSGANVTPTTSSSPTTTNISPGQPSSPVPQTTATQSPTETNNNTNNDLQTVSQPPDPNQRTFITQPNSAFDTDILDATVPPYSKDESDALLKIGVVLSSIARRESSVLVRREVAIAVAELEKIQMDRFIRAALLTEMCNSVSVTQSDDLTSQCEAVYRSLWITLSELAFDPHPVDAAIARRSYDKIYDVIMERTATFRSTGTDEIGEIGDHDPAEHIALFSQSSHASSGEMMFPTRQVDTSLGDNDAPASTFVSPDVVDPTSTAPQDAWRKEDLGSSSTANIDTRGSEREAHRQHVGSPVHSSNVAVVNRTSAQLRKSHTFQSPPLRSPTTIERTREAAAFGLSPSQHKHASLPPHPLIRDRVTRTNSAGSQRGIRHNRGLFDSPTRMVTGSVHVRSSSGSFDLRPSRLAQNIPTMNALHTDNVDHLGRERHANASGWGRKECDDDDDTLSEPGQRLEDVNEGDRPGSVPKSHVIGNVAGQARSFSPPWFGSGVSVDRTGMITETNIDRQTTPLASSPGIPAAVTGIEGGAQLTANVTQTTFVASGTTSSSVIMTRRRLPKSMSSLSGLRVVARSQAPDDNDVQAISPPRPPKRTHSYSVLNAVNSLGSNRGPLFQPSEKTTYFAVMEASEDTQVRERVPAGYSQLLKSGEGNAALSLYEWSSAYISRAEVEASSLDDSKEEEAIPKYATLWSNINRKTGSEKVAERLRKFALLGKGDDVIGMEEQLDDSIGNDDNVQGENMADQEVNNLLIFNNHNKRNSNTNSELIIDDKDNSQLDGQFNSSADTPNSMPIQKQQEQEQTDSSEAHTQFLQPKLTSDSQHSHNQTLRRQGSPPFKPLARSVDTRHEFAKAKQLSLYAMGAGGGSVSALAFLPRDLGIGDDQLVATGDTHGAVGVYDARTGKCQVAFGIPVPPGGREEGVSSILCLNPHGDDNDSSSSHSALILAGSFDGRVAVFKNDFSRPNDFRIMTTFQASGRTTAGKVLTWRDNTSLMITSPNTILDTTSKSSSMPVHHQHVNTWGGNSGLLDTPGCTNMMNMNNMSNAEEEAPSYVEALKQHGKGLVLAFNTDTAHLAAGGLDGDIVRVWNLESERCVWEGSCVNPGQWPTAVTMWKQHHPNVFVVGSSDGVVTLMDMREPSRNRGVFLQGEHSTCDPIMSIGTCVGNAGGATGSESASEVIVSADYGGQVAFWDARWTNRSGMNGATTTMTTADEDVNDVDPYQQQQSQEQHQHSRQLQSKGVLNKIRVIKAHDHSLTTMCVHRSGRYIASGSLHGVKIFGRDLKHGHHHSVLNTQQQQQHHVVSHQRQQSGDESTIPVASTKVLTDGHDVHEVSRKDHLHPVTALAFQHETSLLAIGCMNGAVMVYGKERDLFPGIGTES